MKAIIILISITLLASQIMAGDSLVGKFQRARHGFRDELMNHDETIQIQSSQSIPSVQQESHHEPSNTHPQSDANPAPSSSSSFVELGERRPFRPNKHHRMLEIELAIETTKFGGDEDYQPHKDKSKFGGDEDYQPHKNRSKFGGDEDYQPHKGKSKFGGDEDYQHHKNRSKFGADEDYQPHKGKSKFGGDEDYQPHNNKTKFGGDEDYQPHNKPVEENELIIVKKDGHDERRPRDHIEKRHGEKKADRKPFGSDDSDKIAFKIVTMTNFLNSKSIEELKQYVLKVESWSRNEKGDIKLGGPSDYIDQMSEEKCVNYIISIALKFPELFEEEKFLSIVAPVSQPPRNIRFLRNFYEFTF